MTATAPMRQRNHRRFSRHLQVRFRPEGDSHVYAGYTTNISRAGMFIKTNFPAPPGTRLRVEVDQPGQRFAVEGAVVHAAKVSPEFARIRPSGMGVRFLPVEELIGDLLGRRDSTGDGGTADATPEADARPAPSAGEATPDPEEEAAEAGRRQRPDGHRRPYPVHFDDADDFLEALERDIAEGGLFVETGEPAPLDSEIRIELFLPPPLERRVVLPARVVLRIEPGADGRTAGMGVAFQRPRAVLEELEPLARRLAEAVERN